MYVRHHFSQLFKAFSSFGEKRSGLYPAFCQLPTILLFETPALNMTLSHPLIITVFHVVSLIKQIPEFVLKHIVDYNCVSITLENDEKGIVNAKYV